ncbi:hypothetical protein ACFZB2_34075 [Streptomyces bobili]|uniref:hypothetical protein n=1 Tax=Streptomyces bobili TaxID=67280 RepID=UPI0036E24CE2
MDVGLAQASYGGLSGQADHRHCPTRPRPSLPELGDQRAAITHYNADLDETTAHAVLRVGTVLVELEYDPVVPDDPEWSAEFEQLASMVAARAQQVQNA